MKEEKYFSAIRKWRDIILPEYEIRKSKKQKSAFIDMLAAHWGEHMRVENEKKYFSRNIVIGDTDSADVIFTAHYDTCAVMPFPNFITPKNLFIYLMYQLLLTAVILIPAILLTSAAAYFTESFILTELTLFVTAFGMIALLIFGPANKHTANDNTSGVVSVLALADLIGADNGRRIAFVLFDNEEAGLLGSAAFAKRHKRIRDSAFVVNLDCVSDGDYIMAVFSKKAMGHPMYSGIAEKADGIMKQYGKNALIEKASSAFYPSDQANFKYGTAFAAMNKKRLLGYYVDKIHTPADTVFDEDNLAAIVDFCTTWTADIGENTAE